ncbi:uncharacterized protein BT62DRAFT_884575 [Guyanagaster necrorhizus]|uniref:Uncharacterized protein n=1 Tax=Guyanagaster necrorhizus TaxID=856835 RepID=A0A9P7W1D8_9AGAR|nr:uncharacterized protein BT62DRAFT_884575 [Guyanagaster necrorhizus MCA 3950]KAG7450827.1 hypothetical protein BT62DRAFT_884575 [Guyanagaster necrorhizus MCA 3950]
MSDSGLLRNFILTTLADQLKIKKIVLGKPVILHLAIQDSRSCINSETKATLIV